MFEINGDVPTDRVALRPADDADKIERGRQVLFGGFPHGLEELLVQHAGISGPAARDKGFYIDGSVNGGNSGGPIVDPRGGGVIGVVTQRRPGGPASATTSGITGGATVMGVDPVAMATVVGNAGVLQSM